MLQAAKRAGAAFAPSVAPTLLIWEAGLALMIEQVRKHVQAELLLADTAGRRRRTAPPAPRFAQVMEGGVHDRVMAFAQVTDSVTNSVTNSATAS
jgi:hypothetical protein